MQKICIVHFFFVLLRAESVSNKREKDIIHSIDRDSSLGCHAGASIRESPQIGSRQ